MLEQLRSNIVAFNKSEKAIIEKIKDILEVKNKKDELGGLIANEIALEDLVLSISLYPTIFGEQQLGKTHRSATTLINRLCDHQITDFVFHIPTKAILGNGFAIAKINFFYMLKYLSSELDELIHFNNDLTTIIYNNIYTIMAEDVFVSLISDKSMANHIRINAAYLLANVWEYRLDHGVSEFVPILNSLWRARKNMKPNFGTMMGISELIQLCHNMDPLLTEFITRNDLSQDEFDSLQEFLMGLTHEEMLFIKEEMELRDSYSLDEDEIKEILGRNKIYPVYTYEDARDLYKSYKHRKNNASFRNRASSPGPHKTIEDYIMQYLLSRPEATTRIYPY